MSCPMEPFEKLLTNTRICTTACVAPKVALDVVDLQCRSRSVEALAISRELLAVPVYKPLSSLWRVAGGRDVGRGVGSSAATARR